jgi:hypothetical protein
MGVSSAGVARRAKEGIGGSSSRGLFRKWGAQGKSRLTGPESWTLWCADIRSCMLDGVFCVQCVVVYEACTVYCVGVGLCAYGLGA